MPYNASSQLINAPSPSELLMSLEEWIQDSYKKRGRRDVNETLIDTAGWEIKWAEGCGAPSARGMGPYPNYTHFNVSTTIPSQATVPIKLHIWGDGVLMAVKAYVEGDTGGGSYIYQIKLPGVVWSAHPAIQVINTTNIDAMKLLAVMYGTNTTIIDFNKGGAPLAERFYGRTDMQNIIRNVNTTYLLGNPMPKPFNHLTTLTELWTPNEAEEILKVYKA